MWCYVVIVSAHGFGAHSLIPFSVAFKKKILELCIANFGMIKLFIESNNSIKKD